jgi:stage II sporulation protein D
VASRTFAYHRIIEARKRTSNYDLDATVLSQVYRGIAKEKPSTNHAVETTSGEVILHGGGPILSYFHSTCGGKTVNDRYVWKTSDKPYLEGVRCGFCGGSTRFTWESKLSLDEIRSRLATRHGAIGAIRSISFSRKDDRVTSVTIKHGGGVVKLTGNDFRLLFPGDTIQSLYFTSKKVKGGLVLQGNGWGHGVGMCQWGARGMAQKGYGYKRILNHYYSGVRIGRIGRDHGASILSSAERHH